MRSNCGERVNFAISFCTGSPSRRPFTRENLPFVSGGKPVRPRISASPEIVPLRRSFHVASSTSAASTFCH
jgi:hypothetical protein